MTAEPNGWLAALNSMAVLLRAFLVTNLEIPAIHCVQRLQPFPSSDDEERTVHHGDTELQSVMRKFDNYIDTRFKQPNLGMSFSVRCAESHCPVLRLMV